MNKKRLKIPRISILDSSRWSPAALVVPVQSYFEEDLNLFRGHPKVIFFCVSPQTFYTE